TLGDIKDVQSVKLRISAWAFGEYKIDFSGLESFTENVQFRLIDKFLDEITIINADAEYTFQIVKNSPETYGDNRFELQICPEIFIQGQVATYLGVPVDGVMINAKGDDIVEKVTDVGGDYSIGTYDQSNYTVSATKSDDLKLNKGVTTLDIVMSKRHLLQLDEFTSPYQLIAADVNDSKSLTSLDLVEMRKIVLGIQEGFKSGLTWLFIPGKYELIDDPFNYKTTLDLSLEDQDINLDFVGVKVGDVNNSWTNQNAGRQSKENLEINLEHLKLADEIIEIPFVVQDFKDISGYQFSITWDATQLEYYGIEHQSLEGYINEQFVDEGVLTTMWDEFNGSSVALDKGSVLFVLKFIALDKNANSLVELNSAITEAVAYDSKLNELTIKSTA
ncbi:MAG: hypothetical protein KAI29_21910, partial [Cyclobacteriaceae bacterium]|nr:hypothetical protein [Cyclobacteriaceae bacterium]